MHLLSRIYVVSFRSSCLVLCTHNNAYIMPIFIGVDLAGILRGTHGERRRWVGAEWGGVW